MRKGPRLNKLSFHMLKGILLVEAVSLVSIILIIFGVYRPILQEQALDEAVTASRALSAQIDVAVRSVAGYSDFYANSPELGGALEGYFRQPGEETRDAVRDVLSRMLPRGDSSILSVFVLHEDEILSSYMTPNRMDRVILSSDWAFAIMDGLSQEEFSPFYTRNERYPNDTMMYLRAFYLGDHRCILGMICSTAELKADITALSSGVFSGYALAPMSGPAFLTSGETSGISQMLEAHSEEESFQDKDQTGYYIASTIPSGNWKIVGFLSNRTFNARFAPILVVSLLMCSLVCLFAVIMVYPFTRRLLKPVDRLRDAMQTATQGNMDIRVDTVPKNEIGELGGYFNRMMDEMQELRERDRQTHRTEYDLLTAQINAHYIYNTMSAINSLARIGRCDDVVQVNSSLIRILQNTLRVKDGSLFTTVRSGLDILQSYWSIESIRPNHHAELVCHVEKEVLDLPLLKNILQPLVENSLRHGLTDEETGEIRGRVTVTINRAENQLYIRVEDNGRGIPPEQLDLLNAREPWDGDGRHIGLANIRKRLAFAFGDSAHLEISSKKGAIVEIICPLEQN